MVINIVMANRLASRLENIVSPNQTAFVKGLSILGSFIMAQQTTRALHKQKEPRMHKLYVHKAFNSIS
jgi:hypothetical protein